MPDTRLKNHELSNNILPCPEPTPELFTPDKEDDTEGWFRYYENSAFNKIPTMHINPNKIVPYKGQFKYEAEGITLYSSNPDTLQNIDSYCLITLIHMLRNLKQGQEGGEITVKEYMQLFNISDRSNARKYLAHSIDTLGSLMLELYYWTPQNEKRTMKVPILGAFEPLQRGVARYHLNKDYILFMTTLNNDMSAWLPETFYQVKDKDTLALLLMLILGTRMNATKTHYTLIINVGTLLKTTSFDFKYHERIKDIGGLQQRLIDPFEKKLDGLRNYVSLQWEYCHDNGTPLTDEELNKQISYIDFTKRSIKFTICNYPISTLPDDKKIDKRIPNGNGKKKALKGSSKTATKKATD